jgi:hypothetical protein
MSPLLGILAVPWVLVVNAECLGEVHRFSAWRGVAVLMLGSLLVDTGILVILRVASLMFATLIK